MVAAPGCRQEEGAPLPPLRFDRRELGGALGDVGVLVPLALALIALNGLSASAVFLVPGLAYLAAGLYFRVPVPVQPLKATSALALALHLGPEVMGAAGLIMGVILLALGLTGAAGRLASLFPRPLVRGVQLGIGLLLIKAAWGLASGPLFSGQGSPAEGGAPAAGLAVGAAALLALLRLAPGGPLPATVVVLAAGTALGYLLSGGGAGAAATAGPPLRLGLPTRADLATAFVALVIPQLPLTLANAVVATEDAARQYFGVAARRVRARALATSLGLANVLAGLLQGMPVCHGAGGLTAHYRFGARTGGAPVLMGLACLGLAALPADVVTSLLLLIPLPVLGAFLACVGLEHAALVADLRTRRELLIALGTGTVALVTSSMAHGLLAGLILQVGIGRLGERGPGGAPAPADGEEACRAVC